MAVIDFHLCALREEENWEYWALEESLDHLKDKPVVREENAASSANSNTNDVVSSEPSSIGHLVSIPMHVSRRALITDWTTVRAGMICHLKAFFCWGADHDFVSGPARKDFNLKVELKSVDLSYASSDLVDLYWVLAFIHNVTKFRLNNPARLLGLKEFVWEASVMVNYFGRVDFKLGLTPCFREGILLWH